MFVLTLILSSAGTTSVFLCTAMFGYIIVFLLLRISAILAQINDMVLNTLAEPQLLQKKVGYKKFSVR